jgi:hypothetical protein
MIQMTSTSVASLNKMIGMFGGRYVEVKRKPNNNLTPRFVAYHWALNGAWACAALKKMKPFLVEKKEQADIAIKFFIYQKHTSHQGGVRLYGRGFKLPASVIRKREDFLKRLKQARVASLTPFALAETECENAVMGEATVQLG